MFVKSFIITTIITLAFLFSNAQSFEYTYDAVGNRIARQIIQLQSATLDTSYTEKDSNQSFNTDFYSKKMGEFGIKIYPNPTEGNLMLQLVNSEEIEKGEIKVFDLKGTLIYSSDKIETMNHIDLFDQPQGAYILNIYINNEFSTWKIIKQ